MSIFVFERGGGEGVFFGSSCFRGFVAGSGFAAGGGKRGGRGGGRIPGQFYPGTGGKTGAPRDSFTGNRRQRPPGGPILDFKPGDKRTRRNRGGHELFRRDRFLHFQQTGLHDQSRATSNNFSFYCLFLFTTGGGGWRRTVGGVG